MEPGEIRRGPSRIQGTIWQSMEIHRIRDQLGNPVWDTQVRARCISKPESSEERDCEWEPQVTQKAFEMRQQAALGSHVVCTGQTISVLRRKALPDFLWGTDQFHRMSSFDLTSELLSLLQCIPSLRSQLRFCLGFHRVFHEWLQLLPKWLQSYDSPFQSMHLVLILASYSWYCDNFNMNVVYLNSWPSSLTKYI